MTREPSRRAVLRAAVAGAAGAGLTGLTGWSRAADAAAQPPPGFDTAAVAALIRRYLGAHGRQIELRALPAVPGVADAFEIGGATGHVLLSGTSQSALSGAFNWWVKYVAGGHLSWDYNRLELPARLPTPAQPIQRSTPYRVRVHGNPTWLGYTSPYWAWERWQQELDYFAACGYNHVTFSIGHELAAYQVLRGQGYSDVEARTWIALPAHQPWWWMDNLSGFGGPMPMDLMERRAALARQVIDRLRELGIAAVVPGFMGFVPVDFGTRHPGVDVVQQGVWQGFTRPALVNPQEPVFATMAASFYSAQTALFGRAGLAYSGDFFQEGGVLGDIDLTAAAAATQQAMQTANPGALWMLQGWQGNPRQTMIAGLDTSTIFVLDYQADVEPVWTSSDAFWGAPWSWGTISNGGGNNDLYGRLPSINTDLPAALDSPARGDLIGMHFAPEGGDTNPVLADFVADMFWRGDQSVDLDSWIGAYAARRYGADDPNARSAWQRLLATAYGVTISTGDVNTGTDSLFNAQPDLSTVTANPYGVTVLAYDPAELQRACRDLLAAAPRLKAEHTYRYDLLDVTRQVLDNASRVLLPQIAGAYGAGDRARFRALADHWLDLMSDEDRLLGTDTAFLLGPWIADAVAAAEGDAERDLLEYDARVILAGWGSPATYTGGLHDYANRAMQGLVGDFYHQRWSSYFDSLDTALANGALPAPIDWAAVDETWARGHTAYATTPSGDTVTVAGELWDALTVDPMLLTVVATAAPNPASPGDTVTVTVTVTNTNVVLPATGIVVDLVAPAGLTAGPAVDLDDLAVGATATAEVTVTVPADHDPTTAMDELWLGATVRFAYDGHDLSAAGYAALLLAAPVQPPYRTVNFTPAAFGQLGDTFAVHVAGADMWGSTNQFGAVYLPAALGVGQSVTTRVTAQSDTGPWARAGIVVRDDMTANGSLGFVGLAVTPAHGCALSYDQDGNGKLDHYVSVPDVVVPLSLRLTRSGDDQYTGECSTDGTTWTTVGSVTSPGAAALQDVGLAADAGAAVAGVERFEGFTITDAS